MKNYAESIEATNEDYIPTRSSSVAQQSLSRVSFLSKSL